MIICLDQQTQTESRATSELVMGKTKVSLTEWGLEGGTANESIYCQSERPKICYTVCQHVYSRPRLRVVLFQYCSDEYWKAPLAVAGQPAGSRSQHIAIANQGPQEKRK